MSWQNCLLNDDRKNSTTIEFSTDPIALGSFDQGLQSCFSTNELMISTCTNCADSSLDPLQNRNLSKSQMFCEHPISGNLFVKSRCCFVWTPWRCKCKLFPFPSLPFPFRFWFIRHEQSTFSPEIVQQSLFQNNLLLCWKLGPNYWPNPIWFCSRSYFRGSGILDRPW